MLTRVLRDSGASRDALLNISAKSVLSRARVAKPPPSSQLQATRFNEVLGTDGFHAKIDVSPCRVPVLSMCVLASRYLLGRAVADESSGDFMKALDRGWLRERGSPETLRVDPSFSRRDTRPSLLSVPWHQSLL